MLQKENKQMYFENKIISTTNWLGLWTLFSKETLRFLKVSYQTVLAPIVTNVLFFTIFLIVVERDKLIVGGVQYTEFLVPGLIGEIFFNSSGSSFSL